MTDRWREPRRLAGWEPDFAREILLAIAEEGGEDLALARTSELLAKVFAVTHEWALARDAYTSAAETWEGLDPVRAETLRGIVAVIPLTGFANDREAVNAELAILRRAFEHASSDHTVEAAVEAGIVELRRCLSPRPITGRIEAAFGLAPEELALVMAAVTPIVDPDAAPLMPLGDWIQVLAATTGIVVDPDRLLSLGLIRATPDLVPHPGLASRLLGRTSIDQPSNARLVVVDPVGRSAPDAEDFARMLFSSYGIGVFVGPPASGRRTAAARLARRRDRKLFFARPTQSASPEALVEAALEARLQDGLLAIDFEDWRACGVDAGVLARIAPVVVIADSEPPIPEEARAFTMYPVGEAVG